LRKTLVLAAVAACFVASPALASTTVDFTGTDFTSINGGTPPSTVSGSFSYDYNAGTQTFTLTDLSTTINGTAYTAANTVATLTGGTALVIGGTPNGAGGLSPNDFVLNLLFNPTSGQVTTALQLQTMDGGYHISQANTLSLSSPAAVPEPATWAMMLLGFAGMGFAMRRKRTPALAQVA
jgi:hypothetical protein